MERRIACVGSLILGLVLWWTPAAHALIARAMPLKDVLAESHLILMAQVESIDADKPAVVFSAVENLKGKALFKKLPINLTGDSEAKKLKHTPQLLKRLAPTLPLVVFVNQNRKDYIAFGYTNGTWFQFTGRKADDSDAIRWSFTHCEPYLRGTFKGSTAELKEIVINALAGKKEPPPPNLKEKPGLGPEEKKSESGERRAESEAGSIRSALGAPRFTAGPVFAVIPTVFIGGPLAVLAMLFPTVFGGWQRWLAVISVASTVSTLYFVQYLFAGPLAGTWWGSPAALWAGMAATTGAGTVWAWARFADRVQNGQATPAPSQAETISLLALSLIAVGMVVYCSRSGQSLTAPAWLPFLVLAVGAWVATPYALYRRWVLRSSPAVATEAVMLMAMLLACTALGAGFTGRTDGGPGTAEPGEAQQGADNHTIRPGRLIWTFRAPDQGALASSPLVGGDRVYIAAAHDSFFRPYGALYCLDRATGKPLWSFDDGKKMKQVFSSPCLVDGKLYIGEGFHQDANCKLYCVKGDSGEKVWEFQTGSHVESSPCVANGKVYFGAGDDGLYCVDAVTGTEVWHFPGFHIDASPVVAGGRVFIGSGIGEVCQETAVFGLDAETGKLLWRLDTESPAWANPSVGGNRVYFGLGHGRMNESHERPGGALLCVQAETGSQLWRCTLEDAVLAQPVVEGSYVYFGSRDKHLYCLDRKDGKLAWKYPLASPMVAAPLVARCQFCGARSSIFGVASEEHGQAKLFCLGPNTGRLYWSIDVAALASAPVELFSSPALTIERTPDGERRRIYIGGTALSAARTALLYCFEDRIESEKDQD